MPVDIEFACDGRDFYLLQCRAQSFLADAAPTQIPVGIITSILAAPLALALLLVRVRVVRSRDISVFSLRRARAYRRRALVLPARPCASL